MSTADLDAQDRIRDAVLQGIKLELERPLDLELLKGRRAGSFEWFDDAFNVAERRAWVTGRRQRVEAAGDGRWRVVEVEEARQ